MMLFADTGGTPIDNAFICRREVFDALAAADGTLTTKTLRIRVKPHLMRLRKEMLFADTTNNDPETGFMIYLDEHLDLFQREGMISVTDGTVALDPDFVVWKPTITHPDGRVRYIAGTQRRMDYVANTTRAVREKRNHFKKPWDCLLPRRQVDGRGRDHLRESLELFGFDTARPVIVDSSGTVIDGRERLELSQGLWPKMVKVHGGTTTTRGMWEGRHLTAGRLTPAEGLIRSYAENVSRCTPEQLMEYASRLAELGIDLDELREALSWLAMNPMEVWEEPEPIWVKLPSGLLVSEDAVFVSLRSVFTEPYYEKRTRGIAEAMERAGLKSWRGKRKYYVRTTDLVRFLGDAEACASLWKSDTGRIAEFCSKLPLVLGAASESVGSAPLMLVV